MKISVMSRLRVPASLLALAAAVAAVETQSWRQAEYADFERGALKNLSLRSDGVLSLAPQFRELYDSSSAYLWALARDSAGNLYAGGGPDAKLYRIAASGEKKMLAEFEALEVHAIAIDRKDQVFAATSPDGKVYKVAADGKSDVFYDPKAKYIWALAFDSKGDLFVATGDRGEIHRVAPDGKGSVFYATEETHARSLAVDAKDNVIVGTEPGGLVIRVSPAGEGFVLYQLPKREVTAVAVAKDGTIYAAGIGNKQPATAPPPPAPAVMPAAAPAAPAGAAPAAAAPKPIAAPPALASAPASIPGGSEIYRIHADGRPERAWTHAQDLVYALGFDAQGRPLVGTGNKGTIYRLDAPNLYSVLINSSPTQITAFAGGAGGRLFAASGNTGKVFEIGPDLEKEGTIESDVLDARLFTHWGRLYFTAEANGGRVAVATRSGNLDRPARNWSPWSAPVTAEEGARVTSPPARFLQWKATLQAGGARSPELRSVEVAYLTANVAPRLDQIEITPPNYRFPAPAAPAVTAAPPPLTLPPMGRTSRAASAPAPPAATTPAMTYAKGYQGARWNVSDENSDSMIYTVHIRGVNESGWKLLKDQVRERYLSWDSTAFPDGEYRLRVTASDSPSNPPEQALEAWLESEVFLIDNTPPGISGLAASRSGAALTVRWKATDALSYVAKAEYSLDGGDWMVALPATKLSDSRELDYALTLNNVAPGEHTVAVRVQDDYDNQFTGKVVVK